MFEMFVVCYLYFLPSLLTLSEPGYGSLRVKKTFFLPAIVGLLDYHSLSLSQGLHLTIKRLLM